MNCARVDRLISAYLDAELSGIEMMLVRDHMRHCAKCEAELETQRRVKQALSGLAPVRPEAAFEARLLASLDYAQIPATQKVWQWLQLHLFGRVEPARAAVYGCAALLLVALGHFPQYGEWNDAFGQRQHSASLSSAFSAPVSAPSLVSVTEPTARAEPVLAAFGQPGVAPAETRAAAGFSVSFVRASVNE